MRNLSPPALLWFRSDLRIADNPALNAALATDAPVVAIYILDESDPRPLGAASKWWLHHSLKALQDNLARIGTPLLIRSGEPERTLFQCVEETGAKAVFWNRRYEPHGVNLDKRIKSALRQVGVDARSFKANLLFEPWEIQTGSGSGYRVFSAFWRAARANANLHNPAPPLPAPAEASLATPAHSDGVQSLKLEELTLLPVKPDWSGGLRKTWTPGEAGAHERLAVFLDEKIDQYGDRRDIPAQNITSHLSAHLRFGEISPRQIWHAAHGAVARSGASDGNQEKFLSELGWREFSYHLLYHHNDLATENFQQKFNSFPWRSSSSDLRAWRAGQTGYPLVDAGMRELWSTGYMHNRVRMVAASFLIKHLLIDWREGERWFWDTLVDADPANNSASWQWVAGSGADASPYFRVFNPTLQAQKFDADGDYIRRWVPELKDLPTKYLFSPAEAPQKVLKSANIILGETYPSPLIEHKIARQRALDALKVATAGV